MPAVKGSKQKRGLARRREILTVAVDEIANNGFRRRGLKKLAERVGLSEAGLFHHFGTKNELLQAVLMERHTQGVERFERLLGAGGRTAVEALPALMAETIESPGLSKFSMVMLAESYEPDSHSHDYYVDRNKRFRQDLAKVIEAAQIDSNPDVAIDPAVAATLAQAVMDGVQGLWILDPDNVDPVAVMQLCCELLLRGFNQPPPSARADRDITAGRNP